MIAFAPKYGSKKRPYDYRSFQGWARGFLKFHGFDLSHRVIIDNHKPARAMRKQVLAALAEASGPPVCAFFCHGFRTRIQLGFTRNQVDALAEALYEAYGEHVTVILYACSAGSGPGHSGDRGFADELRDALCRAGAVHCRVVAHVTAGRADANPFVRFFDGNGSKVGGRGGYYPILRSLITGRNRKKKKRRNPLWRPWVKALKGDMRWTMPFMTKEQIEGELA